MAVNFSAVDGASTDYATSSVDDSSDYDDDDIDDVSDVAAAPPPPAKQSIPAPTKKKKLPQKFPPLKSPAKQAKGSTKRLRVTKPAIAVDPQTLERIGLGRMLCIQRSNAILFTLITTTMIGLYWFLLDRLTVDLSYDWVIAVYIFVVTAMVVLYFAIPLVVSRFEQRIILGHSDSKILNFIASWLIQDGSNIETGFQVLKVPAASGPVILTRVKQSKTVVAGRVAAAPILKPTPRYPPLPVTSSSITVIPSEGSDDQVDKTDEDEHLSSTDSPHETSVLSAPPSLLLPVQVTRSLTAGGKPHSNPRNKVRSNRIRR